jgi:hypothetical protein
MSTIVPWQILYGAGPAASITATFAFGTGAIGVASNDYCWPLTNQPHYDPGQTIIDARKAIGLAVRRTGSGYEFQQGVKQPTTSWEFDANAYNLAFPLWMLFQKGTTEGTGTDEFTKTYNSPTCTEGVEVERFANVLKRMQCGSSSTAQRIKGAIVRSITLTAESNTPLKAVIEWVGADLETDYNAGSTTLQFDTNDPLIWGASTAGATVAGTATNIDSWSITVSNNAVQKNYESNTVQKHILMDFTVEGTVKIPWGAATVGGKEQIDNFMNGTDVALNFYWGASATPASSGEISIKTNARYTGVDMSYDDEVALDLPFIGAYDGTNAAIEVVLLDGLDRGI